MPDLSGYFLITDLDGTLLPGNKILSDIDKKAISRFRCDGGKFSIATGRTLQAAEKFMDELKIDMPVIMYNGSLIYDIAKKAPLFTDELPEIAIDIAEELMEFIENPGIEVLRLDNIYVVCNNEYEKNHVKICGVEPAYMPLREVPWGGWYKILFADSSENIDKLEKIIRSKTFPVDFVRSDKTFVEMLPKDSSKGAALKEYIKIMNLEHMKIIAVGDYHNDIEMLEAAHCGAATANAQQAVKDRADIILEKTSDEGAVAELIDRIYSGEI